MSFWQLIFVLLIYIPIVLLWLFALVDLVGRRDLSGLAKGLWAVAIVFLPLIGMIVYFATGPEPESPEPEPEPAEEDDG
jgi:hypothetical protein